MLQPRIYEIALNALRFLAANPAIHLDSFAKRNQPFLEQYLEGALGPRTLQVGASIPNLDDLREATEALIEQGMNLAMPLGVDAKILDHFRACEVPLDYRQWLLEDKPLDCVPNVNPEDYPETLSYYLETLRFQLLGRVLLWLKLELEAEQPVFKGAGGIIDSHQFYSVALEAVRYAASQTEYYPFDKRSLPLLEEYLVQELGLGGAGQEVVDPDRDQLEEAGGVAFELLSAIRGHKPPQVSEKVLEQLRVCEVPLDHKVWMREDKPVDCVLHLEPDDHPETIAYYVEERRMKLLGQVLIGVATLLGGRGRGH